MKARETRRLGLVALAFALLLASACNEDSSARDAAFDGSAPDGLGPLDGSSPACPFSPPAGACTLPGAVCVYAPGTCRCVMGFWHCRAAECPPRGAASGPCAHAGLACDYGPEDGCTCADGAWLCCGGIPMCARGVPQAGAACCAGGGWECLYDCAGTLRCAPGRDPGCAAQNGVLCTCHSVSDSPTGGRFDCHPVQPACADGGTD